MNKNVFNPFVATDEWQQRSKKNIGIKSKGPKQTYEKTEERIYRKIPQLREIESELKYDHENYKNDLDLYIKTLREKLDKGEAKRNAEMAVSERKRIEECKKCSCDFCKIIKKDFEKDNQGDTKETMKKDQSTQLKRPNPVVDEEIPSKKDT